MSLRITVKVTGDNEVKRKLAILHKAGIDNSEVMKEIGEQAIEYYSSDGFATRGRVFGEVWEALSPSYLQWKEKHYPGRGILQASGKMQDGFFAKATKTSVTIDNHAKYYKYHQSTAARSKMPRRPMAGINTPIKKMVREAISRDLDKKLRHI